MSNEKQLARMISNLMDWKIHQHQNNQFRGVCVGMKDFTYVDNSINYHENELARLLGKYIGEGQSSGRLEDEASGGSTPAVSQPLTDTLLVFDEYCEDTYSCPYLNKSSGELQCGKYFLEYLKHTISDTYRCDACKAEFPGGLRLEGVK